MNSTQRHAARQLVLIGGGHSHVEVMRRLAMARPPGLRVTLIGREIETPYTGMLPGFVAGHYHADECTIDLHRLAAATNVRFLPGEAIGLDLAGKRVLCRSRPPLPYDVVSLDIGSAPDRRSVAGAAAHALPVKPVDRFIEGWTAIEARIGAARGRFHLAIVGAGAGGSELAMALRHRVVGALDAAGESAEHFRITLVSDSDAIMPTHAGAVRRAVGAALRERKIETRLGRAVMQVEAEAIILSDGTRIACDAVIWTVSAAPAAWLRDTGLALDDRGFVRVDACLRSVSHVEVFAAGDVAAVADFRLAKAGVYAVREGPVLHANLLAALEGRPLRRYRPQPRALALISTGGKAAVGSWGPFAARGRWLWRVKDRIDRRWMRRYQRLRPRPNGAMAASAAPQAMRCGGCGAKLPADVLHRALAGLDNLRCGDVEIGLDAPDDAAVLTPPAGMQLVQSIDFFRPFIDDPYRFGRIAANHCLGDLHAMGATPHSALALAVLPAGDHAHVASDLGHMLAGATEVLREAGASLIGGHSGEGLEAGFGLSVNGFAPPRHLLRKAGLRPGDALILTKPLGTGVIFAAAMTGAARGAWIEAAIAVMDRSSRDAAACFPTHGAVACTDVTGFGLLGHLIEMLDASGVNAELSMSALPALDGALALLAQGIESTMAPNNRAFAGRMRAKPAAAAARLAVLYDPQTAGGLLAGVPTDSAARCVAALRAGGDRSACRIGTVLPRGSASPAVTLID